MLNCTGFLSLSDSSVRIRANDFAKASVRMHVSAADSYIPDVDMEGPVFLKMLKLW